MYLSRHGKTLIPRGAQLDVHLRVEKDGQVYHSRRYKRVTATNSFTVSFKNECRELREECGQVELYAKLG